MAAEWVQDELTPFGTEDELRRYLRDVRRAARSRGRWWAMPSRHGEELIIVTGSRIAPRNASITNVQEAGVDEGDVVKQIGRFLVVLQDGRLFSIDTEAGGGAELALAGRADVYRAVRDDDWYDELLVRGDRIVVTGYSYERGASELNVFRLSGDGGLEREGIFHISSEDYYDRSNYATRLVGDNLVFYTQVDLTDRDARRRLRFPGVRRVEPGSRADETGEGGWQRRLIDFASTYGPALATLDPALHSVSVCPLAATRAGRDLNCRTRSFIGPEGRDFYVSPTHIYLWVGPDHQAREDISEEAACAPGSRAAYEEAERAVVYRMPVGQGEPEAVIVRGEPFDQFSLDEADGELRAFVSWQSGECEPEGTEPLQLAYASVPLSRFGRSVYEAPAAAFTALPPLRDRDVANRFTETHLAYAPLSEWRYADEEEEETVSVASRLVVVPLARPQDHRFIQLPHNVRRLERAGDDLLLSGNIDMRGTMLSWIALDAEPRLASSLALAGRWDGEGRSHAFNLLAGPQPGRAALFGLPTISDPDPGAGREWWSLPSDISFFTVDEEGRMADAGLLATSLPPYLHQEDLEHELLDGEPDPDSIPGYSCEVSCTDWYGNSRPIFTDGRIFALSATELIEGRLEGGRMVEVRRLDFARARPR